MYFFRQKEHKLLYFPFDPEHDPYNDDYLLLYQHFEFFDREHSLTQTLLLFFQQNPKLYYLHLK